MKFRSIATTIALLIIVINLSAQDSLRRWEIELRPGAALPLGDFGNKDLQFSSPSHSRNGIAKTGISANLSVSYALTKSLGVFLTAGYSHNPQDKKPHKREPTPGATSYEESIEVDPWNIGKLVGGVWLQEALGKGNPLQIRLRAAAGLAKTKRPGFTYQALTNGGGANGMNLSYANYTVKMDPAFCYEAGLQLIHSISKPLAVSLGASLFQSEFKFPDSVLKYNVTILTVEAGLHWAF